MNYLHAYHAGNFADCLKHTLLLLLLDALAQKPRPFAVLDTHAGAGRYDLDSPEARRTGEADAGIRRLLDAPPAPLVHYVELVRRLGLYPGSPALIAAMLRPGDRLACCELHTAEAAVLRRQFARNPAVAVHQRDGYEALRGLLPPAERRGLVLIDPPYEAEAEFVRLAAALPEAARRFPGGVLAAWYPIKGRAAARDFQATLAASGLRDIIAAELLLRPPEDASRLDGCGLVLVNPPYGFAAAALPVMAALRERLGEDGGSAGIVRIADE